MATKISHMRKRYELDDGTSVRSAVPNWAALVFELLGPKGADDKAPVVDTFRIPRDEVGLGDNVSDHAACAVGHGLFQKLGDMFSGIASEDHEYHPTRGYADVIRDGLEEMWADIRNGFWVEERAQGGGGGNVTMLLAAAIKALTNAGKDVDAAARDKLTSALKTKEGRESWSKQPQVRAILEEMKLEKAKARAAKAAEAAEKAGGSDLASLLG